MSTTIPGPGIHTGGKGKKNQTALLKLYSGGGKQTSKTTNK
jgi:hypothetical protein